MRINCLNYTAVFEILKSITDDSPIRSSMRNCRWNIYIDEICWVTGFCLVKLLYQLTKTMLLISQNI